MTIGSSLRVQPMFVQGLVMGIVMLLQIPGNGKLRQHAAAALAQASCRDVFGESYTSSVLPALVQAAYAMDPMIGQDIFTITGGSGVVEGVASGSTHATTHATTPVLGEDEVIAALLRLLSWAVPQDAGRMKDMLVRRAQLLTALVRVERPQDCPVEEQQEQKLAQGALVGLFQELLAQASTSPQDRQVCTEALRRLHPLVTLG